MKRIIILFLFCIVLSPVYASPCTRWYDAEGFERVRCDPNASVAVSLSGVAGESKNTPIEIRVYSADTGQFSVYDRETKVIKHCQKKNGWIDCL